MVKQLSNFFSAAAMRIHALVMAASMLYMPEIVPSEQAAVAVPPSRLRRRMSKGKEVDEIVACFLLVVALVGAYVLH